jgi:hypothetical protein
MTQNEIIEMTRQAGGFDATPKFLEAFAKLVAQHEREACANTVGFALLGADKALSDRVLKAVRARGQT